MNIFHYWYVYPISNVFIIMKQNDKLDSELQNCALIREALILLKQSKKKGDEKGKTVV